MKLLAKLPYHLENKWRDHIKQWRVSHGEISYPPFKRFAEFNKDAADKANIPERKGLVQLKDSKRENYYSITSQAKLANHSSANSFAAAVNSSGQILTFSNKINDFKKFVNQKDNLNSCLFCSEKHHLDTCEEFMKKSFKERKNFFFQKRLCLGCASKTDHIIANCKHKKVCKICSKPHPTCLHQEKEKLSEEENEKQVSNCTSSCINVCSLPVTNWFKKLNLVLLSIGFGSIKVVKAVFQTGYCNGSSLKLEFEPLAIDRILQGSY